MGKENKNNAKTRSVARSSISFPSEKEMEEPQPLPLLSLGDVKMDPSRRGAGQERGGST